MKRLLTIAALCLMSALICACAKTPSATANSAKGTIAAAKLSQDETKLIELLSDRREILLYDFSYATPGGTSIKYWLEAYEYGKPVRRQDAASASEPVEASGLHIFVDEAKASSGRLAVVLERGQNSLTWDFIMSQDGARMSLSAQSLELPAKIASYARAYGSIDEAAEIVKGKEIVLYSCLYSAPEAPSRSFSYEQYSREPEMLNEFPFAVLIKCRFE